MSVLSKHSNTEEVTMKGKTLVALTLLSAFLLLTVTAQAQDRGSDGLTYQPKSETTALMLSLSGTVIPVGLAVAEVFEPRWVITGIFVGPSLGYFYGGEPGRGLKGIAIRGGVATASVLVGAELGLDIWGDGGGWWVVLAGTAFVVGDAIYDVARVRSTVRKHNEKLQARSLGIVPTYPPDSDAPGLALQLTF
jgi:hypothetical protein